jgi:hypothetical protein
MLHLLLADWMRAPGVSLETGMDLWYFNLNKILRSVSLNFLSHSKPLYFL